MSSSQKYKKLLLEAHEEELKALDVYQSAESNLDWLWSSVQKLGLSSEAGIDDEIGCALCQLSLHYGRSALEQVEVMTILNQTDMNNQQKIEAIVYCLDG